MNSLDKFRTPDCHKVMGIEIESFALRDSWDTVDCTHIPSIGSYYGYFYTTRDGSLEYYEEGPRRRGVEFVSQPLNPRWLCKEIDKLFKRFPDQKVNNTCGIHIHVSRKWISTKKAKAISDFICAQTQEDVTDWFGRGFGDYNGRSLKFGSNRYQQVNNTNEKTIEFRMFKSGDAEWAKYCVRCVEYLIANAYHLNASAMFAFVDANKPR